MSGEAAVMDATEREFLFLMMAAFSPEEEMVADEAAIDEAVAVRAPVVVHIAASLLGR